MVALSSVILLHRSPHVHTDNEQSSEQDQNPAAKMAKRERWEEGTHLNQTDLPLDLLWVAELRGAPRALSWPSLQVWHVPPIPNFQPSPSCCSLFFLSAQAQVKISCFSKSSIRRTFFFFFFPPPSQQHTIDREDSSATLFSVILILLFPVSHQVGNKKAIIAHHALQSVVQDLLQFLNVSIQTPSTLDESLVCKHHVIGIIYFYR